MTIVALFPLMLVCLATTPSSAQMAGRRVELFATAGAVVGATPIAVVDGTRVGLHGGGRFDAGIQGRRFGLAPNVRVWQLAPTKSVGGSGVDLFLTGEWRIGESTRDVLRVSLGTGRAGIEPGDATDRATTETSGVLYSLGIAHEAIAPSGGLVLLSADIAMPNIDTDVTGRRQPVLELGVGFASAAISVSAQYRLDDPSEIWSGQPRGTPAMPSRMHVDIMFVSLYGPLGLATFPAL